MCDFRKILEIKFIDGTILDVADTTKRATSFPLGQTIHGVPDIDDVTEIGFYAIAATGSWHMYFDGDGWITEGVGYTVTDFEHTHGHYQFS